jgi:hypothetical protein
MAVVRRAFIDGGFSSVGEELLTVLNRHFGKYELRVEVPGYDPQLSDTLADPEDCVLCQVSVEAALSRGDPVGQALVVSIVSDGEESEERAMALFSQCVGQQAVRPGLPEETRQVERITSSLQALSPNGKLLADPAMGPVLRRLHDVQARRLLGRIATTFGTEPATREALLRAVRVAGGGRPPKKALEELLEVDGLFRQSYLIGCSHCGERALTFATRQQAERALKEAVDPRCSFCREGKLAVLDAYGASEHAAKGLQQGLWLESLVQETLQRESLVALAGRMLEAFELDVACVVYGHVLLVECKDAPFGQNDYMNLLVKAQELGADIVGVVTTNPLHENVKRLVEGQTQRRERDWLVAEDMEDAAQIARTLAAWVQRLRESYLHRLFSWGTHVTPEELSYRRWMASRYRAR